MENGQLRRLDAPFLLIPCTGHRTSWNGSYHCMGRCPKFWRHRSRVWTEPVARRTMPSGVSCSWRFLLIPVKLSSLKYLINRKLYLCEIVTLKYLIRRWYELLEIQKFENSKAQKLEHSRDLEFRKFESCTNDIPFFLFL